MTLRIRTSRQLIELNEDEATELRERLRQSPEAQPAEETIAVSANASSNVTFAQQKKGTVFEVLDAWLEEGGAAPGDGPSRLRVALRAELEAERQYGRWRCLRLKERQTESRGSCDP
jgi:hypothetical protein